MANIDIEKFRNRLKHGWKGGEIAVQDNIKLTDENTEIILREWGKSLIINHLSAAKRSVEVISGWMKNEGNEDRLYQLLNAKFKVRIYQKILEQFK